MLSQNRRTLARSITDKQAPLVVNQKQVKEKERNYRNRYAMTWRAPLASSSSFHPESAKLASTIRASYHSEEARRIDAKVNALLRGRGGGPRRPTTASVAAAVASPTEEETREQLVELLRKLESQVDPITNTITPVELDELLKACARAAPRTFEQKGAMAACSKILMGLVEKTMTLISNIDDLHSMVEVYSEARSGHLGPSLPESIPEEEREDLRETLSHFKTCFDAQAWSSTKLDVLVALCRKAAPRTYANKGGAAATTFIFKLLTSTFEPEMIIREAEQLVVLVKNLADGDILRNFAGDELREGMMLLLMEHESLLGPAVGLVLTSLQLDALAEACAVASAPKQRKKKKGVRLAVCKKILGELVRCDVKVSNFDELLVAVANYEKRST